LVRKVLKIIYMFEQCSREKGIANIISNEYIKPLICQ
jgi:hypothetical protein